jgi:hypothetical protein
VKPDNYYTIYKERMLQLAKTIVVKSTAAADCMNRLIQDTHGPDEVDSSDLHSWKYYLNISGEYHDYDKEMYVVSMDTQETILFSKMTLVGHSATVRAYAYGSRQYKELVSNYPDQELLILGILYPVDIDYAVSAKDGTILGYPAGLVESNEYSLIPKLQRWIFDFKVRWDNTQFAATDTLYVAGVLGIMYLHMFLAIKNFRKEACKTNEAHSFHVKQYLASHGRLDKYYDQLTLKQTLWLYRNIAHIERNSGKKENFEWLVEHIMTDRRLPLAEFVMRHNLSKQPEENAPTLAFRRNPVNLGYNLGTVDHVSLRDVLDKEDQFARSNPVVKSDAEPVIKEAMENARSNVMLTKLLESSTIDYSNNTPYTLEDILLNHWIWLSSCGLYTAYIGVTNPITDERIPLTAKEAYVFAWYAFCRSFGLVMTDIPKVSAKRVVRLPTPTLKDIMSIVDKKYVKPEVGMAALTPMPSIPKMFSTEAFYKKGVELYDAAQIQRRLISSQEHYRARGYVHGMVSRIYSDNICTMAPIGQTYPQWFSERNIAIDDFGETDWMKMYQELLQTATGLDLITTQSMKKMQEAMIRIMSQLSSYSVQFSSQINNSKLKVTDWTTIRLGDVTSRQHKRIELLNLNVRLQTWSGRAKTNFHMDVNDSILMRVRQKQSIKLTMMLPNLVKGSKVKIGVRRHLDGAPLSMFLRPKPLPNSAGVIPVFGIDQYLSLSEEEQQTRFKDIYNDDYFPYRPEFTGQVGDVPLSNFIRITSMNGLNYDKTGELSDIVVTNVLNGLTPKK